MKKKILISNDDGFDAVGIKALWDALKDDYDVTIVAPTLNKSACGHSLTLTKPLQLISFDDDCYKVDDGTPSDCIYLALFTLFDERNRPDLIISGINKGGNMGEDITYSGTASAAMESVLQGIPAISISQVCKNKCEDINYDSFKLAQTVIKKLVKNFFDNSSPFGIGERKFLNVNIPPIKEEKCEGYKVTKAGYRLYGNDAHRHTNPRGEEFYWLGLHPLAWNKDNNMLCDFEAINANFVSITPIHLNMTSYKDLQKIEDWLSE
jgi:5'-nucleotidase